MEFVNSSEMRDMSQWVKWCVLGATAPFSFVYNGQHSVDLLPAWSPQYKAEPVDNQRTQHKLSWTDPSTGLLVCCIAIQYQDFPVIEWTVTFENTSQQVTPMLEYIHALDTYFEQDGDSEFVLHTNKGDYCQPDSYQPLEITLAPLISRHFMPEGGRPTNKQFPYFNLQAGTSGIILAVGWPGQWAAVFERDAGQRVHVAAGQELTHLVLKPGEHIRTPLMAMLFWHGSDLARAQNLWRRWVIAYNMPRPGGKPVKPIYTFCSGGFFKGLKVNEASEKLFIDALSKEKIVLDYWWMDAGWYTCEEWPTVGTWEIDPQRFPNGIKAISDYAHARGEGLVLWFEPERVTPDTWLATQHPEWILGKTLLNLGNPQAREWLTDHVDRTITEQGIDIYRQDFNMDPLPFWRDNDEPDRQGITENLHVQGYLAYWDELLRRHPNLLIDSCASGGRRNDIETLRRAVPLLRSDYQSNEGNPNYAVGNQGHTYGLASWIPYFGHGVYYTSEQLVYCVRSYMSPAFAIGVDVRRSDIDWDLYRSLVQQWRQVSDCLLGDYYPLTPYTREDTAWIAWQFHDPDTNGGLVQAFRHASSVEGSRILQLHGLDSTAQYAVTNIDSTVSVTMSGMELMEPGLRVIIDAQPGAAIVTYKRIGQQHY